MKKAIIHISDLHICLHETLKGEPTKSSKAFWLNTGDKTIRDGYIERFCNAILKDGYNQECELYLLITGDITDASLEKENEIASEVIEAIITQLKIPISRLLILPGDHDINRKLCEEAHYNDNKIEGGRSSYEFEEKYTYFKNFYEKTTKSNFDASKVIVNELRFDHEKMTIIGLNSNHKIDYDGGSGFLNLEKLKKELQELEIPEGYSIIVAFHHNIFSAYENSQSGSWDKDNRKLIFEFFQNKQIKCFLYGNEHTRDSKFEGTSLDDMVMSSDSGCFAPKNKPTPSFKIYDILHDSSSLRLKNNIYKYIDEDHFTKNGGWITTNPEQLGECKHFDLIKKKEAPKEGLSIIGELNEKNHSTAPYTANNSISEIDFRENLFKIVKNKKLFHSGHFHWSETSRAHNWIDITKILNNHDDLTLVKKAILNLIDKNIKGGFDFVIGLGIEGNILSTRVAAKFDKPYSYLPYSYRYEDHNDFEKDLYFENGGKYKSVLIVTDVVNDGRTIRNLIHKEGRADNFFKDVEKIYVLSLFYTGEELNKNSAMLNLSSNEILAKKKVADFPEDRIEYYYVLDLKVEKCPYGENYRDECLIMKEPSLGCVYKFYNEKT